MPTSALAAIGFVGGLAIGLLAWTSYQDRHASALFSSRLRRRAAALSRLAVTALRHPTVDTAVTLREYVAWERHPLLRQRGARLLKTLTTTLS